MIIEINGLIKLLIRKFLVRVREPTLTEYASPSAQYS
jgi:hypothetical protein